MNLPNTFIIGVQKSATTSLYYWLGQHPCIYAPVSAKDYPVFANNERWEQGLDNYSLLFEGASNEKIIMAGSVHTLRFPHSRQRLHDTFPDAKLIVSLRDPVDRVLSAYSYLAKTGVEPLGFLDALDAEKIRGSEACFQDLAERAYVEHGRYCEQLSDLFEKYGQEQVKVVLYDDIKDDPNRMIKDIFRFLGVDSNISVSFDRKNVTGRVRNQWLFDSCFGDSRIRKWLMRYGGHRIPIEFRTKLRHWLKEVNTIDAAPQIPAGFDRDSLLQHFDQDILCLEDLLGRDLSSWRK